MWSKRARSPIGWASCLWLLSSACGGRADHGAGEDQARTREELREGLDQLACLIATGSDDVGAALSDLEPTLPTEYFADRDIVELYRTAPEWKDIQQTLQEIRDNDELDVELKDEWMAELFPALVFTRATLGECHLRAGCDRYVVPEGGFSNRDGYTSGHFFAWGPEGSLLITTRDELADYLGTIDTVVEAGLLAESSGYSVDCREPAGATSPDGFLLYSEGRAHCSEDLLGSRLLVHPNGSIEVLDQLVLERGESDCLE